MICQHCQNPANFQHLKKPICNNCAGRINIEIWSIIGKVITFCGITHIDERSRKAEIVEARYISIYLCLKLKLGGSIYIGLIHGVDHATAIHGKKQVENLLQSNREFQNKYSNFISSFLKK